MKLLLKNTLFSFFLLHVNLRELFNCKAILLLKQYGYYMILLLVGDEKIHTFPKRIGPKVNIIEWLESELAYNNDAVQGTYQ